MTAIGRQARNALFLAPMSGLVLVCFGGRQVAASIGSLRRLKGRASDNLARSRVSPRLLCNRAARRYGSAIGGSHGIAIGIVIRHALQAVSFVAIAAALSFGLCPSDVQLLGYTRAADALARCLSLLLEAKDWIRPAIEALLNQVKDALVGLVSTSTTAIGHQARGTHFLASMSGLELVCFDGRQVAASIGSLRRLKGRASDNLARSRVSPRLLTIFPGFRDVQSPQDVIAVVDQAYVEPDQASGLGQDVSLLGERIMGYVGVVMIPRAPSRRQALLERPSIVVVPNGVHVVHHRFFVIAMQVYDLAKRPVCGDWFPRDDALVASVQAKSTQLFVH
ncbi:hypothetical protein THAOC_35670 [Thalassiosira oceanica]|uniref:Uncharacterized protein n=1 Tax=Thalassiosira oceanica TaxID=159749 RepID=K0R9W9_THAOC|nr:hypothetical protein THAOC_35670 [Thalassiosira oceanica]|eukprot:EJK45701.1 hypothetical protein THAOC_35670 [Thalassiosira oceanica]